MSRRRAQQLIGQDNHDRWLVSYADFITLLFGFFVVMYSVSSVNEGKYRVLSDSIASAFRNPKEVNESVYVGEMLRATLKVPEYPEDPAQAPQMFMSPLLPEYQAEATDGQALATGSRSSDEADGDGSRGAAVENPSGDQRFSQRILDAAEQEVDAMADDVEEEMDQLIDDDMLKVKRNKFWLEVEINSSLLFPSGSSQLIAEAEPALVELAKIFANLPNRINIEGFTDNQPIETREFPSNWELSAARAAAVLRIFVRQGVAPSRMAAIGYGEYHPVADNGTEQGRAANRRVVVIVMASLEGRQDERIYEFEQLNNTSG